MSDTTFVSKVTRIVTAWAQDVNNAVYRAIGAGGVAPTTPAAVRTNLDLVSATQLAATLGSSLIGYIDTGTNAQARTQQGVNRDHISVMDYIPPGTDLTIATVGLELYIQRAIDAAAVNKRDLYFPAATYYIANSLVLKTGTRLVGEGDPRNGGGSTVSATTALQSTATFKLFIKSGALDIVTVERIRTFGGGYGYYFDISATGVSKLKFLDCMMQSHLTGAIYATGNTSYLVVCDIVRCQFTTCQEGVHCDGAFNINRILNCGFETMDGYYLYVNTQAAASSSQIIFQGNRCESIHNAAYGASIAIAVGGSAGVNYNLVVADNYFENSFTSLISVENVTNLECRNNFHTAGTLGTMTVKNSGSSFIDNQTLIGVQVNFTGTANTIGERRGNSDGWGFVDSYTTRYDLATPVVLSGAAGMSLAAVNNLVSGRMGQVKFVSFPSDTTPATLFTVTLSQAAATGHPARIGVAIRALVYTSIITDGNAMKMFCSQHLLSAFNTSGSNMGGIVVTTDGSAGAVVVAVAAGANTTSMHFTITPTVGAFTNAAARAIVLYDYIIEDYASLCTLTLA